MALAVCLLTVKFMVLDMLKVRFLLRLAFIVCVLLTAGGCGKKAKTERGIQRADAFFTASEFEKAKLTYLTVLRLDPSNVRATKQLGVIWLEQGASLTAIPYLVRARQLDPNDLAPRIALCRQLVSLGQLKDARQEAKAILEKGDSPEALLILSQTVSTPDELAETEELMDRAKESGSADVALARSNVRLRRGDVGRAKALIQEVVAAHPESPMAHIALGQLLWASKDLVGAEENLRKAADLAPIRSPMRLTLAQFYTVNGNDEQGDQYLAEFRKRAPDFIPTILFQARSASKKKDFKRTQELIAEALAIDPANFEGRLLLGQTHLANGNAAKALEVLKPLVSSFPGVPTAHYELARAYLANANPTQAAASLVEAIKLRPDFPEALLVAGQLSLQRGDVQNVVDSMKSLLERHPNLLPAQLLLSQAYRSLGNLTAAAKVLQQQLEVTPDAVEPQLLLGIIALQQNDREGARKAFEAVYARSPRNLLAVYHLVEMDIADQKFDAAQRLAQELTETLPTAPGSYYVLARVAIARSQWDQAEAALKKSIDLDANFVSAYDLLVSIYVRTNKLEEARAQTEDLLAHNPENISARLRLAVIFERLKNYEKARESYQKMIESNPNGTAALNNLAILQSDRFNELDKAYELAVRARNLQPESPIIADTLGWIVYRRQDYQQAFTLLQEAAEKLPGNPEVQYHFGMANYMIGQGDAARLVLSKAAASSEDFPGKAEIPAALAMIGGTAGQEMSVADLEALLKERPNDIVVRQRLADLHEKEDAPAKSAALWEDALRTNPKLLSATLKLAKLYAGPLHDPVKAFDYAKKARALAPADAQVARLAGQAAYLSGNYGWAYSLLEDAGRQPGADATILNDLAWTAYNLGRIPEARQAMERAIKAAPDAPGGDKRSEFFELTALEDKPPAEIAAQQDRITAVLQRQSDNTPAQMLQARLYWQQGKIPEAVRIYQNILSRLPEFSPAQKRLGAIYLDQPEQAEAAFDLLAKARKSLPDDPEVAQHLAVARYRRKEYPSTLQLLIESAGRRPLDAKLLFYQGISQIQTRQPAEGCATLEKALEKGLQGKEAEEAREQIAAHAKEPSR